MVNVYKVEFITYTNAANDTVYSQNLNKYLQAKGLLIKETDFSYYSQFGGGFRKLEYVGVIEDSQVAPATWGGGSAGGATIKIRPDGTYVVDAYPQNLCATTCPVSIYTYTTN